MNFYLRVVATELAGWQCNSFWSKDVVRIAAGDCSVRYALVCLSSFYEWMYNDGAPQLEKHQCGLEFYNLAIGSLYQHFHQDRSLPTIIVVCIIFICIDLLRGEHATAMKHFNGAINLINEWEDSSHAKFTEDEMRVTRQIIRPMLRWLNTIPYLLGKPWAKFPLVRDPQHDASAFDSINGATSELIEIVVKCTDFWKSCRGLRYLVIRDEATRQNQAHLLDLLLAWKCKLKYSATRLEFLSSVHREHDIQMVACAVSVVEACVITCLLPGESSWDGYQDLFEEILIAAGRALQAPGETVTPRPNRFCFGIGPIPLLQLVAWKCRWPNTRRRAIHLLRSAKRRETIFDSENVANLFTKLMEIEESALDIPDGEVPKEDQLPPEEARVHRIDVAPLPPTPEGLPVNFLLKRSDGSTHIRCEYVNFATSFDSVKILNNAINLIPP
jgi:hypothetical protein